MSTTTPDTQSAEITLAEAITAIKTDKIQGMMVFGSGRVLVIHNHGSLCFDTPAAFAHWARTGEMPKADSHTKFDKPSPFAM